MMALSSGDPHSYAQPELARVSNIQFNLNVDFSKETLKGSIILTIEKELSSTDEVILDSYELRIAKVTDYFNTSDLVYTIEQGDKFGSKLTIQLSKTTKMPNNKCKIKIEYETHPKSPALCWLTYRQTADGKHPFLLSNNKYTYARAMFPCQDTPSNKFTYSARITASTYYTVLMSAKKISSPYPWDHRFSQSKPVPSYAVIIAVGHLQYVRQNSRIGVWTESKYATLTNDLAKETEKILKIAEKKCGAYPWDSCDICVLPPSVSHFEIECPCLLFVSPTLLGGDISLIRSIARNISQHWTGILVTCAEFKHLWLNKSFSMYIYSRILLNALIPEEDMRQFILMRDLDDISHMRAMDEDRADEGLQECLLPTNLIIADALSDEATRYIPYEKGYQFLIELEHRLGGPNIFKRFLESYLTNFEHQSIRTENWKSYLYNYFTTKTDKLDSIPWEFWFNKPDKPRTYETINFTEDACITLAKRWIEWDGEYPDGKCPFQSTDITSFCDLQKIYFLNHLCTSNMFLQQWYITTKINAMNYIYKLDDQNDEIRFVWLRLCIKCRLKGNKCLAAVNFAITFSSPKFTYPIFKYLYEWSDDKEVRTLTMDKYAVEGDRMLDEIKEKVGVDILHMEWKCDLCNS